MLALFSRLVGYHLEREQLLEQLHQANQRLGEAALVDPITGCPTTGHCWNRGGASVGVVVATPDSHDPQVELAAPTP